VHLSVPDKHLLCSVLFQSSVRYCLCSVCVAIRLPSCYLENTPLELNRILLPHFCQQPPIITYDIPQFCACCLVDSGKIKKNGIWWNRSKFIHKCLFLYLFSTYISAKLLTHVLTQIYCTIHCSFQRKWTLDTVKQQLFIFSHKFWLQGHICIFISCGSLHNYMLWPLVGFSEGATKGGTLTNSI